MSDPSHAGAHSGPIRNPKQLLLAVFFSFVIPVFVIIGLVWFVVSGAKPSGSLDKDAMALGGVVQQDRDRALADRIRKVGSSEMRDPRRVLKTGDEVFKAQCTTCHTPGVANAPKMGDQAAWAPRIRTGFEALLKSSLEGKGAMPPQGGGDFEDVEIARAVAHMANSAGASFAEPKLPAASAPQATARAAPAPAIVAAPDVVAAMAAINRGAQVAAVSVAAAPAAAGDAAGDAVYKQACQVCHASGVANAPKLGDKAAWAPRLALGIDALHASVLKGKGAMPPKGGSTASDADIRSAVQLMVNAAK